MKLKGRSEAAVLRIIKPLSTVVDKESKAMYRLDYIEFKPEIAENVQRWSRMTKWDIVFCRANINKEALWESIGKASGMIILREKKNQYVEPRTRSLGLTTKPQQVISQLGFLLYRVLPNSGTFYIDIVCAAKQGKLIIDYALHLAKQRYKCKYALLFALPQVIEYYRKKFGFIHAIPHGIDFAMTKSEDDSPKILDAHAVYRNKDSHHCRLFEPHDVREFWNYDSKEKPKTLPRVDNLDDANNNSEYQPLLDALVYHRLVGHPLCETRQKCSEHGYAMSKCL